MAKVLLAAGADVNAKDYRGSTPLHSAAHGGDPQTVEILLASDADIHARDEDNRTPLMWAAFEGHIEAAIRLIRASRNADAHGGNDAPLLSTSGPVRNDYAYVVHYLIASGMDVNAKWRGYGATLLHRAAFDGHAEAAEILIAAGADLNAKDYRGGTPLYSAASHGLGIQEDGWPIDRAAYDRYARMAEILIAAGADVRIKNDSGETPLNAAIKNGATRLADLLRAHGGE